MIFWISIVLLVFMGILSALLVLNRKRFNVFKIHLLYSIVVIALLLLSHFTER